MWTRARDLYQKIGMPHMVKQMDDCLTAFRRRLGMTRGREIAAGTGAIHR